MINEPLGDGKPDGKKSIGGSGEMIELGMPAGASKVTGREDPRLALRAGPGAQGKLPDLLHEQGPKANPSHRDGALLAVQARVGSVGRGQVREPRSRTCPRSFWVVVDFRAAQTKGVYVSFDTTTGGKFSRVGLPGMPSSEVNFGGDWMIQAIFAEVNQPRLPVGFKVHPTWPCSVARESAPHAASRGPLAPGWCTSRACRSWRWHSRRRSHGSRRARSHRHPSSDLAAST